MLAAMFMTIEPIAGCSAGTSGNNHRKTGRNARASTCTKPDRSAKCITPSQIVMMAERGSARSITAVLAHIECRFDHSVESTARQRFAGMDGVVAAENNSQDNECEPNII